MKMALRGAAAETRWTGRDSALNALIDLARRWARWRAPRLARAFQVDVHDMASLGQLQDWEDRVLGVTGHWVRAEPTCAVKHETACPFAEIAKGEPRICTELVHALETETFRALNPTYRLVPLERLLSKGDAACEFHHELAPSPGPSEGDADPSGRAAVHARGLE
jgi:hypothetical protein